MIWTPYNFGKNFNQTCQISFVWYLLIKTVPRLGFLYTHWICAYLIYRFVFLVFMICLISWIWNNCWLMLRKSFNSGRKLISTSTNMPLPVMLITILTCNFFDGLLEVKDGLELHVMGRYSKNVILLTLRRGVPSWCHFISTHWGRMTHICITNVGHLWFR